MAQRIIGADLRTETGKGPGRRLRSAGKIPGIIYGHSEPKAITLDGIEFDRTFRAITESTIITLKVGKDDYDVLVKDYQEDLIKDRILHVDFYEIERGKVLRVNVPIRLIGNAQGTKEGGVLENPIHEIEVECLPKDIPEFIELDVTALNIGDVLHVENVTVGEGVRIFEQSGSNGSSGHPSARRASRRGRRAGRGRRSSRGRRGRRRGRERRRSRGRGIALSLLVVGLGNPGLRFEGTRHNVGFDVVNVLARRFSLRLRAPFFRRYAFGGPLGVDSPDERRSPIYVGKPLTFMNRSGEVLSPLMRRSRCSVEDLLIVVDTLDLPVGTVRLKAKGGHAGHRGLQSVAGYLGTDGYPRLYLGIGRPDTREEVVEYVISRPEAREPFDAMCNMAADVCLAVAERGVEKVMNEVNRRTTSP